MIQFDSYASNRLKPPTSLSFVISEWYLGFCVNPPTKKASHDANFVWKVFGNNHMQLNQPSCWWPGVWVGSEWTFSRSVPGNTDNKNQTVFFELNFARDFSNETHQKYPPASIITEPPAKQLRQWESKNPKLILEFMDGWSATNQQLQPQAMVPNWTWFPPLLVKNYQQNTSAVSDIEN